MNLRQQTLKPNKLEEHGYDLLRKSNIIFHPQFVINNKFCVDAYVTSLNLIIQFDGDYWHGNGKVFRQLSKRQLRQKAIDYSQNKYFEKCGYNLIRIWENDLRSKNYDIKKQIEETLLINEI